MNPTPLFLKGAGKSEISVTAFNFKKLLYTRLFLLMRKLVLLGCLFILLSAKAQYPYVNKLHFPDQLSTLVVYDMLTDSKGYVWVGTDIGLFRYNGRKFIPIPFDKTSSKSVSYLQQDAQGKIWCMNFYNQLFSFQNDTRRLFHSEKLQLQDPVTFNNVNIDSKYIWFHSFRGIFQYDKFSGKILRIISPPDKFDQIIASSIDDSTFYAYTYKGKIFNSLQKGSQWRDIKIQSPELALIQKKNSFVGMGVGFERIPPFEVDSDKVTMLPAIKLSSDLFVFHGVRIGPGDYWLCTQSGAYRWNKQTGETKCILPNQRVSDVVRDYQGNYWFSTLDNGIFVCSSLDNTVIQVFKDPALDNFSKIMSLPNGEILAGNFQGTMSKLNPVTGKSHIYNLDRLRETEFIFYDSLDKVIITNRGVFRPDKKKPVELFDYSKSVQKDPFGNLIFATFKGAFVMNNHYGQTKRLPLFNNPLYFKKRLDTVTYYGDFKVLMLRQKRSLTVLSAREGDKFWVGYEDGLYEYHYDGSIRILYDNNGEPVITKSLQELPDGSLVAGTSTRSVMIFQNSRFQKSYTVSDGLSSSFIRKILIHDQYLWVLSDAGVDRIDLTTGTISNYLEEFGLDNSIINDFTLDHQKVYFATPNGILMLPNIGKKIPLTIRFPLLTAKSNGKTVMDKQVLERNSNSISFYYEALHYLSSEALNYQYRMFGIDTIWHTVQNTNNVLTFNRISPGKYRLEIRAFADPGYTSAVRTFSFEVPKPLWQTFGFIFSVLLLIILILWVLLWHWRINLIRKQAIREQLVKSQLVALRAQMNPHFLYNVLNTVQGLVYGNRKTEAGELLGNFSDLMRKTLEASDKQLLPLKDEIENIRLYLELEKARFEKGFSFSIECKNIDDLSDIFIPSLILQPFAENSVKHGLMHKKGEKKISLLFEQSPECLRVVIDDNGIGRKLSMEINARSKNKPNGFATQAINERILLFNRLFKQQISCRIIDKENDYQQSEGTRVELCIPDYSKDARAL
jgi:sensor histidine kinase YesM